MADIRTTEGREELRDGLIPAGALYYHHALLALDGLDIAEDREEHMGSDKIHGAYCLNCLELSRRWHDWQGVGGTKEEL